MNYRINLARVYTPASEADGTRILADRLWPRGIKKEALQLAFWAKDACPSTQLRKSWHANEISFEELVKLYAQELSQLNEEVVPLLQAARKGKITLLSSVKNIERSHLPVLKNFILEELAKEDREDSAPSSPPCYWHEFETN